jgi:hypothetical protein
MIYSPTTMVDGTQRTPPREPGRRSSSLAVALSKMMADRGRAWVPMDAVATGGRARARCRRAGHERQTVRTSARHVCHERRGGGAHAPRRRVVMRRAPQGQAERQAGRVGEPRSGWRRHRRARGGLDRYSPGASPGRVRSTASWSSAETKAQLAAPHAAA